MSILVLEDIKKDGKAEWILSFTDSNPEAKDCFKMIDSQTAFRLKDYLTVNTPISLKSLSEISDKFINKEIEISNSIEKLLGGLSTKKAKEILKITLDCIDESSIVKSCI